jgi:hypothetical protein
LSYRAIVRLLAAAGISVGIGDGRIEKGALTFGLFKLVAHDDPEFQAIVAEGARQAQHDAWLAPTPYDEETSELISWFDEELAKRFAEKMRQDVRKSLPEHEARAAELAAPFDQLWQGLSRYWQKKRERGQ